MWQSMPTVGGKLNVCAPVLQDFSRPQSYSFRFRLKPLLDFDMDKTSRADLQLSKMDMPHSQRPKMGTPVVIRTESYIRCWEWKHNGSHCSGSSQSCPRVHIVVSIKHCPKLSRSLNRD